jgi:cell division protein FtsB
MAKLKKKKQQEDPEQRQQRHARYMALVLLVIMVLAVFGFAFSIRSGHSGGTANSADELPEEVPLRQAQVQGEQQWVTVRNSELFVFDTIDQFQNGTAMESLARAIESRGRQEIYVADDFQSGEALFLIERALKGEEIAHSRTEQAACETGKLLMVTPQSNITTSGPCLVFEATPETAYPKAEALTYHIVKARD